MILELLILPTCAKLVLIIYIIVIRKLGISAYITYLYFINVHECIVGRIWLEKMIETYFIDGISGV